eukprot:6969741-Pyramimonas_sp.AAC.1
MVSPRHCPDPHLPGRLRDHWLLLGLKLVRGSTASQCAILHFTLVRLGTKGRRRGFVMLDAP